MSDSRDNEVRSIATVWCSQPTALSIPERLKEIAGQLYVYRNPPTDDVPAIRQWNAFAGSLPPGSVADSNEVMAAVEHYFYARSQVANGEYSATNMRAYVRGYQVAKRVGLDLRHNKSNPTTPPSKLQQHWALMGIDQGVIDLQTANAKRKALKQAPVSPPTFRMPPNFTGALGGKRLDAIRY